MRFLLDTNILIPLEDSQIPLRRSLADFVRLAHENGHHLLYHPASEDDIRRDSNETRRQLTLDRLRQYTRLEHLVKCPWNTDTTTANDFGDNEILYALYCDAVHALVTEDQGIHQKAKKVGLGGRVFYIQTAETWLRQLHERISVQLPNIEEVAMYTLKPLLADRFFDSLREGYSGFDDWFSRKARDGKRAWVSWESPGILGAVCIFDQQADETITDEGLCLRGDALKLCTFKVESGVRGRKIGELFLKAAFRFASLNRLEHIFIHGDEEKHRFLFDLLEDFGFLRVGTHPGSGGRDAVYLKQQPALPPETDDDPFVYLRKYFPHFRRDRGISKFIVPIRPEYHEILFPDYEHPAAHQNLLFRPHISAGNAIKLAYLCHAPIANIAHGSVVLFYRSRDHRAVTSLGVVEDYQSQSDPSRIAQMVSRRTVYSMNDIQQIAVKPTKVMLFRHVKHFANPIDHEWLEKNNIIDGNIQTIRAINDNAFQRIFDHGER
jgi:hypothetical protein